jgi:hypothetical protein
MKQLLTLICLILAGILTAQEHDLWPVPSGLRNTGPLTEADAAAMNSIKPLLIPAEHLGRSLPDSIDNSQHPWFRPVFSQESFPNCMQATSIAYNFTYEINRLRDLPADITANQYPTHFAWNFFNGGDGWFGVNYLFTMDVLKHHGTPNVSDYGGFYHGGGERWMSGYDQWYNAMNNRIEEVYKIFVGDEEGLLTLKHWLSHHGGGSETGGVASFMASSPYNLNTLPEGSPQAGKKVITSWYPEASHGMTIIGYNDSIRYDYNGDGQYTNHIDLNGDGIIDMRDREIGALKFCNSYGETWADSGFAYMMYKTLADDFGDGGIWTNTVHVLGAKAYHDTRMAFKVSLEHNYRQRIRVRAGISGNLESDIPEHVQSFSIFNYQGGWHYMQGNDTTPENKTIEFGLDITPLLSYVETGKEYRFFLIVDEKDPENLGYGQIKDFSLIDYQEGFTEIPCIQQNVILTDNGTTMLYIDHLPSPNDFTIVTDGIPPLEAGQPLALQLEAAGGQEPYRWYLDKNYDMGMGPGIYPGNEGELIIGNAYTDHPVAQALGFSFPFYGNRFDTVMVSPCGYIFFDENMYFWSYLRDMAYFLRNQRVIAPLLCQEMIVNADYGHGVWYAGDENGAVFRWINALEDEIGSSKFNFAVKLFPDGNIDFYYGDMELNAAMDWVAGISDGDLVNYSLPELPALPEISPGTRVIYRGLPLPDSISLSTEGLLKVYNGDGIQSGISVLAVDNTLLGTSRKFQLTDGLEMDVYVQGSTNNTLKSGQFFYLNLMLKNQGVAEIEDLHFILSCEDPGLMLIDNSHFVQTLPAGEHVELIGAFSCQTDPELPDRQVIVMRMDLQSAGKTSSRPFIFESRAPMFMLRSWRVTDADGILDPGETAPLMVEIANDGLLGSGSVIGRVVSEDPGITVIGSQAATFGELQPGARATATFDLTASYALPYGKEVSLVLKLEEENGLIRELPFSLRVGKVPVCIVDMDPGTHSGPQVYELLQQMGVEAKYTRSFPLSLDAYQSVILCLGKYFSYHDVSALESNTLIQYLDQGGRLYMEGRLAWTQQPYWDIFGRFNIETMNMPGLYNILDGTDSTFTEGLAYANMAPQPVCYQYLVPQEPAFSIFTGREYPYCAAVAHDAGTYKTVGTIFELGGLVSSDTCLVETFMWRLLEFFDVQQSALDIDDPWFGDPAGAVQNYPNPFSGHTHIPLFLDERSYVRAEVYDMQGRLVYELLPAGFYRAGTKLLEWNGKGADGQNMPAGIYIYRIVVNGMPLTGKMIMLD